MPALSRRDVLKQSSLFAGSAAALLPFPTVAAADAGESAASGAKLKIVVAGAHPDDPESGCGGTMLRYALAGHEVVALYLTRGEAGIRDTPHDEAARIRTVECNTACEILKARPVFAGQIDGSTEISPQRYDEFAKIIEAEAPDAVFAHWPVDTHRDHRAASLLAYDAWLRSGKKFALYYFEVMSGSQSQNFHSTDYVDITAVEDRKRAALFAHASQHPEGMYAHHAGMSRFRGYEMGTTHAEAFVRHAQSRAIELP